MKLEEEIGNRFICSKCRNQSGVIRRFAATGTGLSRILDFQHNSFLAVSCDRCGFTELYDPRVFERKDSLADVLDLLFTR